MPPVVVAWTRAEDLSGKPFDLPARALITSRFDPTSPKKAHYALVCSSDRPLELSQDPHTIEVADLQNLLTGRPVASSQVTAVVQRVGTRMTSIRTYAVAFRVRLKPPFFLRLLDPVALAELPLGHNWNAIVAEVWTQRAAAHTTKGN